MRNMKKKISLGMAAVLMTSMLSMVGAMPVAADEAEYEMTLLCAFNDNTVHGGNAVKMGEFIEEATDGRIKVTVCPVYRKL